MNSKVTYSYPILNSKGMYHTACGFFLYKPLEIETRNPFSCSCCVSLLDGVPAEACNLTSNLMGLLQ